MKRFLLFFIIVIYKNVVFCQTVSLDDAKQCAQNYYGRYSPNCTAILECTYFGVSRAPNLYVFNMSPEGWVIVSADYRTTPILAISFKGVFDTAIIFPDVLRMIIKDFSSQVEYTRNALGRECPRNREWGELLVDSIQSRYSYEPNTNLLDNNDTRGKIRWQQQHTNNSNACLDIAYNKYAPTNNPLLGLLTDCDCDLPPAGCASVAMGQLMWYWQWPKKSPLSYREGYNWNLMPERIVSNTDWEEADEIAFLLKDLGAATNSVYTCLGTFAGESDVLNAWHQYGYQNVSMASRSGWDYGYSWIQLIRSEIDNSRPVMLCGYGIFPFEGHYFIVDGYLINDINLFHLNIGWGNVDPEIYVYLYDIVFSIDRSDHNYNNNKMAFVGISPTYSDTIVDKAYYQDIKKTDYEFSIQEMVLPAANNSLKIESGAKLKLVAGKEIIIRPGFEAKAGSEVTVEVDTGITNRMPIIVTSWPTTVEVESDGLYVDVKNANSYELTVRDLDGNIKYQVADRVWTTHAKVWSREYDYDPSMTYECTIRFKNNFGRALQHTFLINEPDIRQQRHIDDIIDTSSNNSTISIYPNPAHARIVVEKPGLVNAEITMYNNVGQPCFQDCAVSGNRYYIDASQFPKGVYYIMVLSETTKKIKKVTIQ